LAAAAVAVPLPATKEAGPATAERRTTAAGMELVSPSRKPQQRRARLTAIALAIAMCGLLALVAVRRGQQPTTILASDTTVSGDTIFEHDGDDADVSPASLSDAAIAFGDKKTLQVEDHKAIASLKSEVKSLEAELDNLNAKLGKRKGKMVVNVAVGRPGRTGDLGPMGPMGPKGQPG
jgi:hypothetical protein